MAKLEFPRYAGDDPTEWFSKISLFFDFEGAMEAQKVALASFHLEGGSKPMVAIATKSIER